MDSWHSRPQADLFQELDARPGGLTRRQAEERLARYGPNQLEPPRRPGLLSRVMAQMKDPSSTRSGSCSWGRVMAW